MARPASPSASSSDPSLWPREHGAYVVLLGPLLAALAAAASARGLAWALCAAALFVAHEPLLWLLGRRGRRARDAGMAVAVRRLALCVALGVAGGLFALHDAGAMTLLTVALALGLALLTGVLVALDRERTLVGELVSGAALLSLALPVLALGGVRPAALAPFFAGFALLHVLGTLTARAYVYRKRDGGLLLRVAVGVGALVLAGTGVLAFAGLVPLALLLAPCPVALVTFALAAELYRPRSPRGVGLWLTAAHALSLAPLALMAAG